VVTIRTAVPEDAVALARLARSAYEHYVVRIGQEPAPMNEDYSALIGTGNVWVAQDDGVPMGLLVLKVKADHVLLDNIAVSPEFQRAGIGAQLLAFTDGYARDHGLAEIRLYTNEAMAENIAYYSRHGFAETHRGMNHGYRRVFFTRRLDR
jgi:ribosomal protein S18 acetylase RimI-like enzyme